MVPVTYWSMALEISALFTPVLNFMESTRGWCLSHQKFALSPARRVQWIRDCCPAPMPITWRTWDTAMSTSSNRTSVSKDLLCRFPQTHLLILWKRTQAKIREVQILFKSLKGERKLEVYDYYLYIVPLNILDISSEACSYWNLLELEETSSHNLPGFCYQRLAII